MKCVFIIYCLIELFEDVVGVMYCMMFVDDVGYEVGIMYWYFVEVVFCQVGVLCEFGVCENDLVMFVLLVLVEYVVVMMVCVMMGVFLCIVFVFVWCVVVGWQVVDVVCELYWLCFVIVVDVQVVVWCDDVFFVVVMCVVDFVMLLSVVDVGVCVLISLKSGCDLYYVQFMLGLMLYLKVVVFSYENVIVNVFGIGGLVCFDIVVGDGIVLWLLFYYDMGLFMLLLNLYYCVLLLMMQLNSFIWNLFGWFKCIVLVCVMMMLVLIFVLCYCVCCFNVVVMDGVDLFVCCNIFIGGECVDDVMLCDFVVMFVLYGFVVLVL